MVEFVTLFLGALIAGPIQVRLQVHQEVAALEIRLDERSLATLREAPWELEVDFGEELAPHLLEAVAYSGYGREIGRASQWVNLTPEEIRTTIALDRDRSTGRVQARLGWQSLSAEEEPVRATAIFDGEALEVRDPRVVTLPPHDPDVLHQLRVELEFPGPLRSAAEIAFGGPYGETVTSGLTAFPVSLEPARELPAVDSMEGWFRSAGRPLRVHAAEKGLAEIVVVRSPSAERHLAPVNRRDACPTLPVLSRDHRLRFVGVRPQVVEKEQGPFVVFPRSPEIGLWAVGLRQLLGSVGLPEGPSAEARLSDAVGVAGLFAHRSGRRRAVVLITTGDPDDASQFDPARVRRYLERIGVPLAVWNPEEGETEAGRWGAALNIATDALLEQAYGALRGALDRQRIVWLDGLVLPQTIVVDPGAEGARTGVDLGS